MPAPDAVNRYAWRRWPSRTVRIGALTIGGSAPIAVQSMTTTPTTDVSATVRQCIALAEVGCQIVRVTAPAIGDARALAEIRREFSAAGFSAIPLVADIHFMPAAAMEAVEHVEKVRVNPGNFADRKRFAVIEYSDADYAAELARLHAAFSPLVRRAKTLGRALRIGVNHGSLSDRIVNRYGDTPAGMVESAMEFIRIAEDHGLRDLVISMKSSNPKVMVHAYRALVARLDAHGERYPLHLGVTEAGDGEDGRIKGAAGIGGLLEDGYGDTIRVSLTEDPVAEVPVALALARRYAFPVAPSLPPAGAPAEAIDPLIYQRRVAGIVRLGGGGGLPIGGGQSPAVLAPERVPIDDTNPAPADATVADGWRWSNYGERVLRRPTPSHSGLVQVVRLSADSKLVVPERDLVLLDLPSVGVSAALRHMLASLPESVAVGLADPGPLGLTRGYRLLAAVDEELFRTAEASDRGSGVRHALCLAWLGDSDLLHASAVLGGLLTDGLGDCLYLPALSHPERQAYALLQAVRARSTRTDYVACPSCGRTLFDLMEVTGHIKEATAHLDGVTIAIMGCIVNGPGEMADADFGYVGSGPGKITLYKGREPVRRNLPMAQARDELVALIKQHGKWKEPPQAVVSAG